MSQTETTITFLGQKHKMIITDEYKKNFLTLEIKDDYKYLLELKIENDFIFFGRYQICNIQSMAQCEWLDKNLHFKVKPDDKYNIPLAFIANNLDQDDLHVPRSEAKFIKEYNEIFCLGKNKEVLVFCFYNEDDHRPSTIISFNNNVFIGFVQSYLNIGLLKENKLVWKKEKIWWVPTDITLHRSFPKF